MPVAGHPSTGPPPPPAAAGAYYVPPPPPGRHRRWLPPIVLLVVLLFVVFGGYVVAVGAGATAAADRAETPGSVTVGGLRFRPLPGWAIARRFPGPEPGVLLTRGVGSLLVADAGTDSARSALDSYFDRVLLPEATELHVAETIEEVPLSGGITALRRAYAGRFADNPAPLEGDVTAFVLPGGPAVIFDGWAHESSYPVFAPDVYAMAGTAEAV